MVVDDIFYDGFRRYDAVIARFPIQLYVGQGVGFRLLLIGRNQHGFQGVADDVCRNPFFFRQKRNSIEQFLIHGYTLH